MGKLKEKIIHVLGGHTLGDKVDLELKLFEAGYNAGVKVGESRARAAKFSTRTACEVVRSV